MDNGDRQMVTVLLHISHDQDNILDILDEYPNLTIDLNSEPQRTPITGPKSSLIPLLLDYYYWDHDSVTSNHPQITQSDIDGYMTNA